MAYAASEARGWDTLQLLRVITELKSRPDIARGVLERDVLLLQHEPDNRERGLVTSAVKLMLMVDCSPLDFSSDRLEKGTFRTFWADGTTFSKFVQDAFPIGNHPALSFPDSQEYQDIKSSLSARRLERTLGIHLLPTDDLRDHLKLDRQKNSVLVYHYVGFLKEHLRLTKHMAKEASIQDGLSL